MHGTFLMVRSLVAGTILVGVMCSGGGVDVGNPLTGTVSYQSSQERTAGAMVVLAKRGADPGWGEEKPCTPDDNVTICTKPIYFDTVYTDDTGAFQFDTVYPGSYILVATKNGLSALEGDVEQRAFDKGEDVSLFLDKPATVQIKTYDTYDTAVLHFRGVRVAGTGFVDVADENGEMVLRDVPAGELDLILYRSDEMSVTFSSLHTEAGGRAELYIDPAMPVSYWTPHPCGPRDPLGRPFVLETYIPAIGGDSLIIAPLKTFDLRISFSHSMDAVSTAGALHGFSDDAGTTIQSLMWEGGNVVYVSLCIADTTGSCDTLESRFKKGIAYGVTIDTTAETDLGVHFAHEATVRFVPDP